MAGDQRRAEPVETDRNIEVSVLEKVWLKFDFILFKV